MECPMVRCLQCGAVLPPTNGGGCAASISGSILGDEYTESYFLCDRCGVYTVEVCCEPFLGEEEVACRGPVPAEEGEAAVSLIKQCAEPWDKKCRCPAHITYFKGALD
jgi:hypothetical protein